MKRALKAIGIIYLVLAIIVGSLAVWQWDVIKGIYIGIEETAQQIEDRRIKNQEKLVEDINQYMENPVREITEEEKKQIESGQTTLPDVYAKIFEEREMESKQSTIETPVSSGEKDVKSESSSKQKNKDEIISKYMAQMYSLQSEFTARAEATISQGAHYYESIKSHPQDAAARAKTISHFTPVVRGIEAECDGRVESVIANLKKDLEAIGAETDIIRTIRATYKNEKQLKLSYYSNKYLK